MEKWSKDYFFPYKILTLILKTKLLYNILKIKKIIQSTGIYYIFLNKIYNTFYMFT